jgi:hypothetical protein
MQELLKLRWREAATNSAPTFYSSDNETSTTPVSGRIGHRKKSLSHSTLCLYAFAIRDELHQLLTVESTTPTELPEWIGDQPKAGFALIRSRKILERRGIKQHRSEAFHSRLSRPRQQGVAGALKQRNTESASIVDRKPISIGASHGK